MKRSKKKIFKAAVLGDPIGHSLSPLLHQTWLQELGLLGEYKAVLVKAENFEIKISQLFADPDFVGANITLPHKQRALHCADQASPLAKKVGAANLLFRKNNTIIAENTDVFGFLDPLYQILDVQSLIGKTALVFGGGGAAKAVVFALCSSQIDHVFLCNRSQEKAETFFAEVQNPQTKLLHWDNRNQPPTAPDIVINASSAGMTGFAPLDINLAFCGPKTVVYDLVYQPIQTPLLQQAKEKNIAHLGGLDMLIAQASPSFHAFFGVKPPQTNLAKSILLVKIYAKQGGGQ